MELLQGFTDAQLQQLVRTAQRNKVGDWAAYIKVCSHTGGVGWAACGCRNAWLAHLVYWDFRELCGAGDEERACARPSVCMHACAAAACTLSRCTHAHASVRPLLLQAAPTKHSKADPAHHSREVGGRRPSS